MLCLNWFYTELTNEQLYSPKLRSMEKGVFYLNRTGYKSFVSNVSL